MAYISQYAYYVNSGNLPENANWGSYQYVSLEDVVNNFMLMYNGNHELVNNEERYKVLFNNGVKLKEMEKVTHSKITMLNNSLLTAPNETFPAYTLEGNVITSYPSTIDANGEVKCQYFRYPKDPKWTYVAVTSGEPVFNSTAADYQDFELPLSDEPNLVVKILEYAGISIRETEVVQFAKGEEAQTTQEEQ